MEKLEQHTNVISQLKEEINTLTEQGKEKDSEFKDLSNKVKKTEEEVQNLSTIKVYCAVMLEYYLTIRKGKPNRCR